MKKKQTKRTDDLPGVVLAAEYSHKVGDRDAPLPLHVEVLERPPHVVIPDEHVPVDSGRQELLIRPQGQTQSYDVKARQTSGEGGGHGNRGQRDRGWGRKKQDRVRPRKQKRGVRSQRGGD